VTGLGRQAPIQVQANVKDIDPKRTDVVTVRAIVKKRPDIAVTGVSNPPKVYTNQPVTIAATIAELNGDVGATGKCALYVDNALVDQAPSVWVDAASTVSCQFSQTFTTAGTRSLKVAFSNAVPAEWSTSNNAATSQVEVVLPIVNLNWNFSASSGVEQVNWSSSYSYDSCYNYYYDCSGNSNNRDGSETHTSSSFNYYASAPETAAPGTMSVEFRMSTDGSPIGATSTQVAAQNGCVGTYDQGTATFGQVCSTNGNTSAQFNRNAGAVTYFSQTWWSNYQRYTYWYYYPYYCYDWWYGYSYVCGYNSYPYTYSYYDNGYYIDQGSYASGVGAVFSLGNTVEASLTMTDASGRKFVGSGTAGVQGSTYSYPYNWYNYYNGWYYYYESYNSTRTYTNRSAYGSGFGNQ
jgi:hypothetical protein